VEPPTYKERGKEDNPTDRPRILGLGAKSLEKVVYLLEKSLEKVIFEFVTIPLTPNLNPLTSPSWTN
jgi:hypothetical protein